MKGVCSRSLKVPIQPVEKLILCRPYDEPNDHWLYDPKTGQASHAGSGSGRATGTRPTKPARPRWNCSRR
jgi:hypothetical protein